MGLEAPKFDVLTQQNKVLKPSLFQHSEYGGSPRV